MGCLVPPAQSRPRLVLFGAALSGTSGRLAAARADRSKRTAESERPVACASSGHADASSPGSSLVFSFVTFTSHLHSLYRLSNLSHFFLSVLAVVTRYFF